MSKSYVMIETEPCPFLLKNFTLGDNHKEGEEQLKSIKMKKKKSR